MNKKITALVAVFALTVQSAYASVLGSVVTSWSHDMADGTDFYKNVFLSEQSGVGKQTEYYAEYTPNTDVLPTVVSGESIWGLNTITGAEKYMKDNGMTPLVGINASFFSFKTGVPMGHVISDGKIMSKDTESYRSIGFRADGTAFIAPLEIETTLSFEKTSEENDEKEAVALNVAHINKYNQTSTDVLNLYTRDFAPNNHTDGEALNIILGIAAGELSLGKSLTAVVEEKFVYTGSVAIPDGKIMLTLNSAGNAELLEKLNLLDIGDEIVIDCRAGNDADLWNTAVSALGSVGDTLVADGEVQSGFEKGAAPRTAVGITESGNVIFYVIDGRQTGYSYGVQLKTLAARMKELGCVEAINLDGGGSTAISGIYPGSDASSVLNSPSEGGLRSCSNYIFLKNNRKATGELGKLYIYPFEQHYLSGYSEQLYPTAVDTAYYKTENPDGLEFSVNGTESTVDKYSGMLTAKGTGEFTVGVTGGNAEGSTKYHTYETPTNINVYDGATNAEIKSLTVDNGDVIKLNLTAQYYYIDLKTSPECFEFAVSDGLGYVSDDTELVITANRGSGKLTVKAGDYTKEIPISLNAEYPFGDTENHWARDMIASVYDDGIINGYETDDGLIFKPNGNMTRAEFAVIMCNFLDIDTAEYKDAEAEFSDNEKIADWSKPYVAAVSENGLMSGKSEGEKVNFAPNDKLTRAEAMTVLGRCLGLDGSGKTSFADDGDIPDWAKKYVAAMVSAGFANGYEDNTVRPLATVTRAEAVTLLYKIINTEF